MIEYQCIFAMVVSKNLGVLLKNMQSPQKISRGNYFGSSKLNMFVMEALAWVNYVHQKVMPIWSCFSTKSFL